ncbi:hypothetical protein ACH4E8_34205 [Streptomyces sp. NPDC017979]|uniref:hypothetical protein n=1 Tax=Streptomyces sp. NPDC017979 TaxID=3365024 RepID=UPI00378CB527
MLLIAAVEQSLGPPEADAGAVRVLTASLRELCTGQSADLSFEGCARVDLAECLAMAEGQTGALPGAACELGALAAGSDGTPPPANAVS